MAEHDAACGGDGARAGARRGGLLVLMREEDGTSWFADEDPALFATLAADIMAAEPPPKCPADD